MRADIKKILYTPPYMSQTAKFFLVGMFCFILGAGAILSWSAYSKTQQENALLKEQLEVLASPESSPLEPSEKKMVAVSPSPVVGDEVNVPSKQVGAISGTTGYPSESIPPLEIFAFKANDHTVYFKTTTQTNQQSFTIDSVMPGDYVVVAYPIGTDGLTGGYTQAVPCGLSVACTDHSLIEVSVAVGETVSGVEVKDWYAPSDQFPVKP